MSLEWNGHVHNTQPRQRVRLSQSVWNCSSSCAGASALPPCIWHFRRTRLVKWRRLLSVGFNCTYCCCCSPCFTLLRARDPLPDCSSRKNKLYYLSSDLGSFFFYESSTSFGPCAPPRPGEFRPDAMPSSVSSLFHHYFH